MFDRQEIRIAETVDAKKAKLADEQAWALLVQSREIVVGSGKKILVFTPSASNKQNILQHCLGRTGNLRAPAVKVGNRIIIGYNDDMYQKYLG